jgi:putative RecB family exonuclease
MAAMWEVPTSLSPSRVDAFTSCPLAFRFASIEKLPEPPTVHTAKGTLVHRALELLFTHPQPRRTRETAHESLQIAIDEMRVDPDFALLALEGSDEVQFFDDAAGLVDRYLELEDPTIVRDIGLELRLEAQVGELTLRGIIDRLEIDDRGDLVVTDYKTGRAPSAGFESKRLGGVHFYSFLCEAVLGARPARIRLMYLRSGQVIETEPSEQSVRFLTTRTHAVWKAVARACETDDFRPRPGALCSFCTFKPWCPAFGGDPSRAAAELTAAPLA